MMKVAFSLSDANICVHGIPQKVKWRGTTHPASINKLKQIISGPKCLSNQSLTIKMITFAGLLPEATVGT